MSLSQRIVRTPVDGFEYVSVVTDQTDGVTLITRFSGDVTLGPIDALRLARALIGAALRVALRP